MADLTNSHSLTDFQRNARDFISDLNASKEPLLLTVNGKIEAVLVDPATFQAMEAHMEKERFLTALKEGLADIDQERSRPVEDVYNDLKAKYGF